MEYSIISGEKLQYLCDCYIGYKNMFQSNYHTYNKTLYENKIIYSENIKDNDLLLTSNKIFIYTELLFNLDNTKTLIYDSILCELMKKENNFIIVLHNSDMHICDDIIEYFEKTKCQKIFTQNLNIIHNNIQYLPIGIANRKWMHGNKELLNNIMIKNIKKDNKTFFNFNIGTNPKIRNICYNSLKNKIKFTSIIQNQKNYLETLSNCKFCIVPQGHGFDTHRLWECFYLKVIPICIRNTFTEIIYNDFPCMYLINDWSEINFNLIYEYYDSYIKKLDNSKLDFSYWKNLILKDR